ncbi:MAG: TetR/AcrR family transcriptional regulator [Alphaproteobacteria bacterium]
MAGTRNTGRSGRSRKGDATKVKILDAAEQLFAHKGFDGVTVRQITRLADVDVALVNYHFGSKRDLFDAVLLRRAEVVNRDRLEALADATRAAAPAAPPVESIIDAFLGPLHRRVASADAGWKDYFALIAQVNNSHDWGGEAMTRYFDPVVRQFVAALQQALPDSAPENIYWSYHFLSGALTLSFAETGRIDNLSAGLCESTDHDALYPRMVKYCAAGFRALCKPSLATDAG